MTRIRPMGVSIGRGPVPARAGRARVGRDLRHHPARRHPARGHLASPSTTSCASPSSSTTSGVGYIEGGWPGANPKDDEFFRRAVAEGELRLDTSSLVAFGSTRRVKGKVDEDPTLANLVQRRHRPGVHRREVLGLPRHRGAADHARGGRGHGRRLGRLPRRGGPARAVRRRALLRRVPGTTPSSASACSRRPPSRAPRRWCCATPTAGRCPPTSSGPCARSPATSATTSRSVSTCTTTPAAGWPTPLPASAAAPSRCRAPSTGTASGPATATSPRSSPTSASRWASGPCLPGRLERLTAVSHHVAELVNLTPNPQAPFVGPSAFAHKAGLHVSAIVRRPDAYEHIDPNLVGNGTRFVVSELAGKSTLELKAAELGPRARTGRPCSGSPTSSRTWSTTATTSRPPTARSSCSCARPAAGARTSSSSRAFRVIVSEDPGVGDPGRHARPSSSSGSTASVAW